MLKVKINGEAKEVGDGLTLGSLIEKLGIPLTGVAVEVNREIVPKRTLSEVRVNDGDTIEIIRMVGGG